MASKRDALVASAEKSLAKGKVDSALKDYQKVLVETPGDVNILNKAGDLLTRLNRNEEAIPYFTKIAEHFARDGILPARHRDLQEDQPAGSVAPRRVRTACRALRQARPHHRSEEPVPGSRGLPREEQQRRRRGRDLPEDGPDGSFEHPAAREAGGPLHAGPAQGRRPEGIRRRRGSPARPRRHRRIDPGLREGAPDGAGQRRDPAVVRPDPPDGRPREGRADGRAPRARNHATLGPAVPLVGRGRARRR